MARIFIAGEQFTFFKDLRGHLALITGSGHGVGAQLCVELGRSLKGTVP